MSLGGIEDVGLEAARARANALTSAARLGRDLVKDEKAARDEAAREFTVEGLIEEYLKRRVYGRLRSATDVELRLRRTLASIMKRKATEIRRRELRDLFDAVADAGHKGEAEKRRATVSTMFAWAVGQDICKSNPSEGLSSFDGARKARERVLSADEIAELWQWCETIPPKTADVLKLQLLLGARVTDHVDISLPFAFYRDLLVFGPQSLTAPGHRSALNAAIKSRNAKETLRLMSEAVGDFDKKRVVIIGAAIKESPRRMSAKVVPAQRRIVHARKEARSPNPTHGRDCGKAAASRGGSQCLCCPTSLRVVTRRGIMDSTRRVRYP
jgi:hypothetical protein